MNISSGQFQLKFCSPHSCYPLIGASNFNRGGYRLRWHPPLKILDAHPVWHHQDGQNKNSHLLFSKCVTSAQPILLSSNKLRPSNCYFQNGRIERTLAYLYGGTWLTLTLLRWGRCEKNYLPKEEGREGGEKKAGAARPPGPGLEPGTCRVLGECPQLHTRGSCLDKLAFPGGGGSASAAFEFSPNFS